MILEMNNFTFYFIFLVSILFVYVYHEVLKLMLKIFERISPYIVDLIDMLVFESEEIITKSTNSTQLPDTIMPQENYIFYEIKTVILTFLMLVITFINTNNAINHTPDTLLSFVIIYVLNTFYTVIFRFKLIKNLTFRMKNNITDMESVKNIIIGMFFMLPVFVVGLLRYNFISSDVGMWIYMFKTKEMIFTYVSISVHVGLNTYIKNNTNIDTNMLNVTAMFISLLIIRSIDSVSSWTLY